MPAEDDFEIEFDETPSGFGGEDMGFEIEIDDAPTSLAEPEEKKPAPAKPAAAKAKEPEPKPEPEPVADDAIADFLSGIKLDD